MEAMFFVNSNKKGQSTGKPRKKYRSRFLLNLFGALESNEFQEITAWTAEGTAFEIRNPVNFEKVVLPRLYRHSNMKSFTKQLNMYKFQRANTKLEKIMIYYHPLFLRGRQDLLGKIERTPVPGKNLAKSETAESDELSSAHKKIVNVSSLQESQIHCSLSGSQISGSPECETVENQKNDADFEEFSETSYNPEFNRDSEGSFLRYKNTSNSVPSINYNYIAQIAAMVNHYTATSTLPEGFQEFRNGLEKLLGFHKLDH